MLKLDDILYQKWPARDPKAVLLLVHGLGAHSARWEAMADFFAKKGSSSYAIELKGFGETTNRPRGHIDSFNIYYRDILKLSSLIKRENPGRKVFILGESMGGLIAFILAGQHTKEFSGLIMISPAFKNAMKFSLLTYLDAFSSLLYNRRKILSIPFTLSMCTRDIEYVRKMEKDPRESREASSGLLFSILSEGFKATFLFNNFSVPTLFLLAGKDLLVDENSSRKAYKSLRLKDKTIKEYPEMLHALSIEHGKEKVFKDILSWLEPRL